LAASRADPMLHYERNSPGARPRVRKYDAVDIKALMGVLTRAERQLAVEAVSRIEGLGANRGKSLKTALKALLTSQR
jgi:hypothetical protein